MTKTIDTLVADIYKLFDKGHKPDQGNLDSLGKALASNIQRSLERPLVEPKAGTLRMSNVGKPDRQIWYDIKGAPRSELRANTRIKFLFGDLLETILIFLAKEAGHEVTDEQAEVTLEGVTGHLDCQIDNVVVDCKSASPFSFKKFKDGSLLQDDPFGYIDQVSSYAASKGKTDAALLAIDKQNGTLCLMQVDAKPGMKNRIRHLKEVVKSDTVPERCYPAQPDGKSGNLKLGVECSYCQFKEHCWKDSNGGKGIRTFLYSTGPRFLVRVEKAPDVMEITGNGPQNQED